MAGSFPIPAEQDAPGPRAMRQPARRRPEQAGSVVGAAERRAQQTEVPGPARGSAKTRGPRLRVGTARGALGAPDVGPGSGRRAGAEWSPAAWAVGERWPEAAHRPIAIAPPSDALPHASGARSHAGPAGPSTGSVVRPRHPAPGFAGMHLPASWDRLLPEANLSDGTLTHVRRTDRCPRPASGSRFLPTRWRRSRPRKARRSSAPRRID